MLDDIIFKSITGMKDDRVNSDIQVPFLDYEFFDHVGIGWLHPLVLILLIFVVFSLLKS